MAVMRSDWLEHVKLAQARPARKQLQEAIHFAERALAINPDAAMAHQVAGLAYSSRVSRSKRCPT